MQGTAAKHIVQNLKMKGFLKVIIVITEINLLQPFFENFQIHFRMT